MKKILKKGKEIDRKDERFNKIVKIILVIFIILILIFCIFWLLDKADILELSFLYPQVLFNDGYGEDPCAHEPHEPDPCGPS